MNCFVCSWTRFWTSLNWPNSEGQDCIAGKHAQMQQWRTIKVENLNCTLIWSKITSPFTAIVLKRGSLLLSAQEVRAGRKWLLQLHFPLCHTFVLHLMSEERQLNIAFTDVGTPPYLTLIRAGQLLFHSQETNKQGVPFLWTPPNKPARQTSLQTRLYPWSFKVDQPSTPDLRD